MKRLYLKLASILLYIGALIILLGVRISSLFSLKLMLLLGLGTVVLFLPYYSNKLTTKEIGDMLGRKALDAGYIQTFILLFICLSQQKDLVGLFENFALNCRPLLYGYCVYILMITDQVEEKSNRKEQDTITSIQAHEKNQESGKIKSRDDQTHGKEETFVECGIADLEVSITSDEKESRAEIRELTSTEVNDKLRKMSLTKREAEVAYAIMKGMTNREIAENYYVSEATVKKHVSHIFEKLEIQKREEIKYIINKND